MLEGVAETVKLSPIVRFTATGELFENVCAFAVATIKNKPANNSAAYPKTLRIFNDLLLRSIRSTIGC